MLTGAEALAMAQNALVYTVGGIAAMVVWLYVGLVLINRRWGWIPRRRQRKQFGERF